jgi:hypothetical protein
MKRMRRSSSKRSARWRAAFNEHEDNRKQGRNRVSAAKIGMRRKVCV